VRYRHQPSHAKVLVLTGTWQGSAALLWRGTLLLTAVVLALSGALQAAPTLPTHVEDIVLAVRQPEWANGRAKFWTDRSAYNRLFRSGSARVEGFPLPTGAWVDLDLVAVDLLTSKTRFFARGENKTRETAGPPMRFFRGKVAGDPASVVSLNLYRGKVAGFIRTGGAEYTFGPKSFAGRDDKDQPIEVRNDATDTDPAGQCDGPVDHPSPTPPGDNPSLPQSSTAATAPDVMSMSSSMGASIDGNTLLLAHVAVEGTVEWVNHHGGVAAAEAYSLNLIAQVSAIYETDMKVQLQVPYILMNTSEPDGYSGGSNSTGTILSEMVTRWNDPTTGLPQVFRSAAHLFSTYPSGGSGRAYVNVLCDGVPGSSNVRDLGVSLLSGNGGSWERGLVAHELGHNFSSSHTHCYAPEIDQCYNGQSGCFSGSEVQSMGTIMSYCNSSLDVFHQRVLEEKLRPAAEAAYPSCMDVAGMPGSLSSTGSQGIQVAGAQVCSPGAFQSDDGTASSSFGYSGSTQAAWVKKFTPDCYPFKLESVDVTFRNTGSVAAGRPVRLLVYTEAAGTGSLVDAALAHSEDTSVQTVGNGEWNQYTLSEPVTMSSGDFYVGFFDLDQDSASTYIMDYDSSTSGDSSWQGNSTSPGGFGPFDNGTWMLRANGGGVDPDSVELTWDVPCNDAAVPNQDYAIYKGNFGDWTNLTNLSCTTGHAQSFLTETTDDNIFWLVVPQNSANEGSYGHNSQGERSPSSLPCKPQALATTCP
jgi:hypothetical protein